MECSFWFIEVASLHFSACFLIRRISGEWERVETSKAKCNGLGRVFWRVKFCINMTFNV